MARFQPTLSGVYALLLSCVFAFSAASCRSQVSDRDIRYVSIPDVADALRDPGPGTAILDARAREQFDAGHIPGAMHVPLQSVSRTGPNPRLDAFASFLVYGETPADGRSIALTKRLIKLGKRVSLLEEGVATWRNRGLPLNTADGPQD